MLDAHDYAGPIAVTVAYVAVYYAMQVNQVAVKTRLRRVLAYFCVRLLARVVSA
jgi:hypothetical protein